MKISEYQYNVEGDSQKTPLDEESYIKYERCHFCGGELEVLEKYMDTPLIHHTRCKNCHAVSYDKVLTQAKLDEFYANYSYTTTDAKSKETSCVTFWGIERFARHLLKISHKVSKLHTARTSEKELVQILDFGGGDGAIAYALARKMILSAPDKKVEITVADYNKTLTVSETERIVLKHVDSIYDLNEQKYDIIIASAILEHVPNLREDFEKLISLMGEGGFMYIRTPYKYPLFKLLRTFGVELDLQFPQHIWDLGKKFYEGLESDNLKLLINRPSIVESTFRTHFFQCLAAHLLKFPYNIFHGWPFVGGWEAVYVKVKK